jgi:hypothetical protein
MADIYNFNTLIHEKYPELVEYWLETFNEMVKLKQDYDNLSIKHAELIGLNDMLVNIIKAYNLECEGVKHAEIKEQNQT